jgi:hypothetical protein
MLTLNTHIIQIKEYEIDWALWNLWGRGWGEEIHTGIYWGNLKERVYLKDAGVDGRIILRCILLRWYTRAWTGPVWFGVGTSGKLLRIQ